MVFLGWLVPTCGPCMAPPQETDVTKQLKGVISFSFEHSGFVECGSTRKYWFGRGTQQIENRDPPGWEKARRLLDAQRGDGARHRRNATRVYVEMRGRVSGPGHYGHLGQYDYSVEPLEITDARAKPPSDCQLPSPR